MARLLAAEVLFAFCRPLPRIPRRVNLFLDSPVLVLNRLWQPVNTCSARRAISLIFLGHAQVVWADDERTFFVHDVNSWMEFSERIATAEKIRSVSRALCKPEIIVLSLFDRLPKKQVKFTRENVYRRDEFLCQYCGRRFEPKDLNLDHVVPRDKGGKTSWENVVCSCIPCNTRKANKLPAEANMFPRRQPKPPSWRPLFSAASKPVLHPSWSHFLDPHRSQVELTD